MIDARVRNRTTAWLVGAAALVVVATGVRAAAWIIAPVALAAVLVLVVNPLRRLLVARGWPGWAGALAVHVTLIGLLVGFALVLVVSVARLSALVPQYAGEITALGDDLAARLEEAGVKDEQASTVISHLDPATLARGLASVLGSAVSVTGGLVLIVGLLIFMAVDASGIGGRMSAVGSAEPGIAAALRSFAAGTRRYLLVATVFGLAVAVLDGLALWMLGIPLPVLWALLSFVTNYIPNIGFILGLVPPALLGLLDGGWTTMLWVVAVYSVVNFVLQSVVQPKIVGDTVNLSVTVSFVAVIFWTWLIGGMGAVLAVPLTLLVKALLIDSSPSRAWTALLASNSGALRTNTSLK